MPKNARLCECTEWIDSGFVEREQTPHEVTGNGIRHHLAEL